MSEVDGEPRVWTKGSGGEKSLGHRDSVPLYAADTSYLVRAQQFPTRYIIYTGIYGICSMSSIVDHVAIEIRNMSADMILHAAEGSTHEREGGGVFSKARRSNGGLFFSEIKC